MTKTFKSLGVKSGYQAFSTGDLRGTIYMPKGYFVAGKVPATLTVTADFAVQTGPAATVEELKAEAAALRAELALLKAGAAAEQSAPVAELPAPVVSDAPAPVAAIARRK